MLWSHLPSVSISHLVCVDIVYVENKLIYLTKDGIDKQGPTYGSSLLRFFIIYVVIVRCSLDMSIVFLILI